MKVRRERGGRVKDAEPSAGIPRSPGKRTRALARPRARATAEQTGAGVKALEELLQAGIPEPAAVVQILDAHRDEHEAILSLVEARLGADYRERVVEATKKLRLDVGRRELVAGDPAAPKTNFFVASQEEKGARWRDGRFDGKADGKGLDSHYRVEDDRSFHFGIDSRKREGVLGYEKKGKTQFEVFERYQNAQDNVFGVRVPYDVGDGATLTGEARRVHRSDGVSDELAATYEDSANTASAFIGGRESNPVNKSAGVDRYGVAIAHRHQLDPATQLTGAANFGSESYGASVSASHEISAEETVAGSLAHSAHRDGSHARTTLSLTERYRGPDLLHGADLTATTGDRDVLRGVGSVDGELAPNLYAGAFGSFTAERNAKPESSIGASLTFTPHEKEALSIAGIIDQDGQLETRLALDIFRKRVDSVEALSDQKKRALISLFVTYSTGTPGMLDDRFGEPELERREEGGGGTILGGIRIRF